MGLTNWMRGKRSDPVDGTFRVVSVTPFTMDQGQVRLHIAGVVSAPGISAAAMQVKHTVDQNAPWPQQNTDYPAQIDLVRPDKFVVAWPDTGNGDQYAQEARGKTYTEQVARAIRLGLDPSIVPQPAPTFGRVTMRDLVAEGLEIKRGNQPLVDGSLPINATEAEPLYANGIVATATITGIDFLDVDLRSLKLPPGARIAHVALDVHRADGTTYQALSRFGFRNATRVERLGHVGAEVPVRIDPANESRILFDGPALSY